jgi:putative ABC transport system permease protein
VLRAGSVQKFSSVLDEDLADRIRGLDGVREVTAGLADVVSFHELDLFGVPLEGLKPGSPGLAELEVRSGRSLRPDDAQAVMLGHLLARSLDKAVGQTVDVIPGEPFEVVGIFESPEMPKNSAMIVPLDELQRLMDREGKVTYFLVGCRRSDRESLERVAAEIEGLAPALEALPAGEYVD